MSALRRLLHLGNAVLPPRPGIVVLTYHLVDGGTSSSVDIPVELFKRHLQQLRGRVISIQDALDHLAAPMTETYVVLTFDDAFENFHRRVWPLLRSEGFPAVLYVPTDFVDGRGAAPLRGAGGLPPCTWRQLRELSSSGLVTIGSHSCTHRDLSRLPPNEVERELVDSRTRLESELGVPIGTFCYPGGRESSQAAALVDRYYANSVVRGGAKAPFGGTGARRLSRIPIRRDAPADLGTLLAAPLWLEEHLATRLGRLRDRIRSGATQP